MRGIVIDVRISLLPWRPGPLAKKAWSMILIFFVGPWLNSPETYTFTRLETKKEYLLCSRCQKNMNIGFHCWISRKFLQNKIYICIYKINRILKPSVPYVCYSVIHSIFVTSERKHRSSILKWSKVVFLYQILCTSGGFQGSTHRPAQPAHVKNPICFRLLISTWNVIVKKKVIKNWL